MFLILLTGVSQETFLLFLQLLPCVGPKIKYDLEADFFVI